MRLLRQVMGRVFELVRNLSAAGVIALGAMGWVLLGAALVVGQLAGWDEPYGNWDSARNGAVGGLLYCIPVSSMYTLPLCLLPAALIALMRRRDARRGLVKRDDAIARAWLLSAWVVLPVAVLAAPFSVLSTMVRETVMPDEVPAWALHWVWHVLGHWYVTLGVFALALANAVAWCMWMPLSVSARMPLLSRCIWCRYERAGLPARAACPECGRTPLAMSPVCPPRRIAWSVARVCKWVGLTMVLLALGWYGWRATVMRSLPTAMLCWFVVATSLALACGMFSRHARARAIALCECLFWAAILVLVWLWLTRLAEYVVMNLLPGASPRAQRWWFFSVVNEYYLVPIAFTGAFCAWFGWKAPRYVEEEGEDEVGTAVSAGGTGG
jgi:hypothetical protein